jgi:hypothetical protein
MNTYELHIETWDHLTNAPTPRGYEFHGYEKRVEVIKGCLAARARGKELARVPRTMVIMRGPVPSMKGKIVSAVGKKVEGKKS